MDYESEIKLNNEQREAVEYGEGPVLIVAGAGTGKTRVITERIRYLIKNIKAKPNNILALTFTEKASEEMVNRVDEVMPIGYEEPYISTFHSFCDRILREDGLEIGLNIAYKIINYPQQWLLVRKNLFNLNLSYFVPLGNPTKFIGALLNFFSRLQDEDVSKEEIKEFMDSVDTESEKDSAEKLTKERWSELFNAYEKYRDLKIKESVLDFGDLIYYTLKLFRERPNILKKYQAQFKYILVDEFQDTNYAQYELIKLIAPADNLAKRSLMVVGDDNQSIYKFRGAAVSNILEFQENYSGCEMITLLQNYRSNQPILDAAYKLVTNNNPDTLESKLGISKELVGMKGKSPVKPRAIELETLEDEVEWTMQKILEIVASEPQYTYKDFAILARANSHLDPFVLGLRKYGLPYQLVGNRGLYDREEVRDILALLKVLVNPLDAISLYRVLNIDVLNIPHDEISRLLSSARYKKTHLWEVLSESTHPQIQALQKVLGDFRGRITKDTPVQIVYQLVSNINYLNPYIEMETVENQMTIKNMDLFLNRVKKFEIDYRNETREIPTIVAFIDYIELMIQAGDNPAQAEIEDIETINLMTVHSSKGLEFPVVFMVDLISNRFPTRNRTDEIEIPEDLIKETLPAGDPHIQEERRLFYVGMTRAQKYLFLTYAKNYGGKRDSTPSGFLTETGIKTEQVDSSELLRTQTQTGLFGVGSGFREPKIIKTGNFSPTFLSYTQISTYLTCPLKYKFSYILNIPTPPNHALSFGSCIHNTLRDFHIQLRFRPETTYDELIDIYTKNWQPLGFINEQHRMEYFENGRKLLEDYYRKNMPLKVKPLEIEKSFNIRINGIKFGGRIDRIDPLEDGGVEIIDYKTGGAKSQKDVDKDAQVAFYALGAIEALNLKPKKLTLYYVENGEKITTTRTEADLENKKKEIAETLEKIRSGDFESTPGMHCNWCDYKEICPFAYRG